METSSLPPLHSDVDEPTLEDINRDKETESLIEQHNKQLRENNSPAIDELPDAEEELEVLEPKGDPKRWVFGKPPERGGKTTEYLEVWQRPLGFMDRSRFYALVGKTLSTAIRASGGSLGGMEEVFGEGEGTILERGKRIREHDFQDASSFFALAMELVGYNHEFLSDFYIIALGLSTSRNRGWVRDRLDETYDPENDSWGLSDDVAMEIIEVFIDQNYEAIRSFFVEKLPLVAKRIAQQERNRKGEKSLPLKS